MAISVFDLFTIGIGPSSSHTVGPMRAALMFVSRLQKEDLIDKVARVTVQLYGSLGATGRGHGTHKAVVLGLEGETPEGVDVDAIPSRMQAIETTGMLTLHGSKGIAFNIREDLVLKTANHCRVIRTGSGSGLSLQTARSCCRAFITLSVADLSLMKAGSKSR